MATLMELGAAELPVLDRLSEIEQYLEESGGVFESEEQEAEYDSLLVKQLELAEELTGKIDAYGFKMTEFAQKQKEIEGRMEPIEEILSSLRYRRNYYERRIAKMKAALLTYALNNVEPDESGKRRIIGDYFRYRVQANGGADRVELLVDDGDVPDDYTRRVVDTNALLMALKSDAPEERAYAERFARIADKGVHIRQY